MQDVLNISALFLVPLIFLVPGYVLCYICRDKKLKFGFLDTLFLVILGSILLSGWLGLILAELGFFSIWNLALLLLITLIPLIVKFHVRFDSRLLPPPTLTPFSFSLLLLMILAGFLFLKPYPWIVGGRDQGVYVNTGINIAKTGSILIHDSVLGNMSNSSKSVFYSLETKPEVLNETRYQGSEFPGFYITDKDKGEITPQFFYLYPTWVAIFYSIFGLELCLYVTPILALLALLSVFFLGKTLFNEKVALLSSLLLTLNFAQIWYAREPSTEILTQLLIFSGLTTLILFNRNPKKYLGILSAFCFGEAFLTRISTIYLAIPLVSLIAYLRLREKLRKEHLYFIIPLGILSLHAVLSAVFISTPYTFDIYRFAFSDIRSLIQNQPYLIEACSIVAVLVLIFLDSRRKWISRQLSRLRGFTKYSQHLLSFLLIIAVLYSFFIRPTEGVPESYNLIKLSWYLGGLFGIVLAALGLMIAFYKKPYAETYLFLGVMLVYSVYFIANAEISLDHPGG